MVTPLARLQPVKVARETATLDRLSNGRLTLGVGLGLDRSTANTRSRARSSTNARARMLDEGPEILQAAWSGELVEHRGEHYTVDGMRSCRGPCSAQALPIWVAGSMASPGHAPGGPRHQGFLPVNLEHPDQVAEIAAALAATPPTGGKGPGRGV
jgi:alkanesulfonate monooxygenase SsuD/methylene tetrahydromethanopterin reductase-like flavin-dependent oxidoreductase (luciferase family)